MKALKNPCNIYIALWSIYNLQGLFYNNKFVSQLILIILLGVSSYHFILSNLTYKLPRCVKILTLLICVFTIYGIYPIVTGTVVSGVGDNFQYLKQILISLLPLYSFIVYSKKGFLTEDVLRIWSILFFVIAIAIFFFDQNTRQEITGSDDVTSKQGYAILSLLPLIPLFYKKPLIQYLMMVVISVFVLMSVKRGAILTCAIAETWILFSMMSNSQGSKNRIRRLFLSVIVLWAVFYAVEYYVATNDYFNYRIEQTLDGNSSNRDMLYQHAIDVISSDNLGFNFWFGHGAYGTRLLLGNYAHNDWLEILINNGVIVFLIYLIYWIQMGKIAVKSKQIQLGHQIIVIFVLVYFVKTFFSMSYSTYSIYTTSVLGYALTMLMNNNYLKRV